ncbi:MAG: hypothetical protein ACHQ4H_18320, partial [Ktedonobacterales bacterium]
MRRQWRRLAAGGCAEQVSRRRGGVQWGWCVAALLLLPVLLACGATYTLAHAPASALSLHVEVSDSTQQANQVTIFASVHDTTGQAVVLTRGQQLACGGAVVVAGAYSVTVPKQPPGGSYTCTYRDEQGHSTAVAIPVPAGVFAITFPREGSHVHEPAFTASGPNGETQRTLTIRYSVPTPPTGATETVQMYAVCGTMSFGQPPPCTPSVNGNEQPASGSYMLTTLTGPVGFDSLPTGPVTLVAGIVFTWTLAAPPFRGVSVRFSEQATVHMMWTSDSAATPSASSRDSGE